MAVNLDDRRSCGSADKRMTTILSISFQQRNTLSTEKRSYEAKKTVGIKFLSNKFSYLALGTKRQKKHKNHQLRKKKRFQHGTVSPDGVARDVITKEMDSAFIGTFFR